MPTSKTTKPTKRAKPTTEDYAQHALEQIAMAAAHAEECYKAMQAAQPSVFQAYPDFFESFGYLLMACHEHWQTIEEEAEDMAATTPIAVADRPIPYQINPEHPAYTALIEGASSGK